MRPAEIARMEGVKDSHGVRGMIIRVSDQLRCGEISLFERDPVEAEEAKARLEAERAQRRKRYAKNREAINEKRRESYVPQTAHEKKLAKRRAYYAANKFKNREKVNAQARERYAKNKDHINALQRERHARKKQAKTET